MGNGGSVNGSNATGFDLYDLVPQISVQLSGRITILNSYALAVLYINNSHYYSNFSIQNFAGIPGLGASLEMSATYGSLSTASFYIRGELNVPDLGNVVMQGASFIIGLVADAVDVRLCVLTLLVRLYSFVLGYVNAWWSYGSDRKCPLHIRGWY